MARQSSNETKNQVRASKDGAIMRALRYDHFGEDSCSLMAKVLSNVSGYKVHREHISAYENGSRILPDKLVEGLAKVFGVSVEQFPEYSARRVTPAEVAHPVVAWARTVARDMSDEEGAALIGRISGIEGSPFSDEDMRLFNMAVRPVPQLRLRAKKKPTAA